MAASCNLIRYSVFSENHWNAHLRKRFQATHEEHSQMEAGIMGTISSLRVDRLGWTALFVLFFLIARPLQVTAQLGALPPLPPVTAARAEDGLTAKIGDENLHL